MDHICFILDETVWINYGFSPFNYSDVFSRTNWHFKQHNSRYSIGSIHIVTGNPTSDSCSDAEDEAHPVSSSPRQRPPMTYGVFDLCFPALNYLHRCHKILTSIHQMPSCPTFRGSQSIKLGARECYQEGEMSPQRCVYRVSSIVLHNSHKDIMQTDIPYDQL